jgi:hypothetical protein
VSDIPDDVLYLVIASILRCLNSRLGRDPTHSELVRVGTGVMIRVGMILDAIAEEAGADHRQIIWAELAAAERWRHARGREHEGRRRA